MSHETEDPPLTSRPARRRRDAGALIAYILLALLYTWPLIQQSASGIADEPYDPILNASVLWWNATTIPFSHHWWNPPFFHPTQDVAAFTENLSGLSLVASPVYWLTHNPLTAYNLTFFLTWPLSAFTMYLFVASLTGRRDAGFLAGLAFAFTPYRMDELVHIQSLASFWLPLVLLGLHRFLEDRRARWLLMFAAAWLLESLTDGYYMFFGGVLVVLWLGYFCSRRDRWRAVPAIVMTWVLASVPLAPLMWEYHVVHERYGLRRTIAETIGFSARMKDWIHVSQFVWFWSAVLRDSDNRLFPGMTALILVMAGAIVTARGTSWRSLTARTRAALKRRSPLVFYVAATIVAAILCLGPVVRVGQHVILDPAPYRWLMIVPGFDQLRVPTRFWMIGILCLSAAAGLSFVKVAPAGAARAMPRALGFSIVAVAVMLDGWLRVFPIATPPMLWPGVESHDRSQPILELPPGPDWDAAATFRSISHRRPVINGVSGYAPPDYAPLLAGLESRDPEMLMALASLGSFDVIVNGAEDRDGAWRQYAADAPGAVQLTSDGIRIAYGIPAVLTPEVTLGDVLPIAAVRASEGDASTIVDGRHESDWQVGPQQPGEWVIADLGRAREIGGVDQALGERARDFPRLLAIDVSVDGETWDEVWEGPTAARAFLAAARAPRHAVLRFALTPRPARFIRLRQLASDKSPWSIAGLDVHAPTR